MFRKIQSACLVSCHVTNVGTESDAALGPARHTDDGIAVCYSEEAQRSRSGCGTARMPRLLRDRALSRATALIALITVACAGTAGAQISPREYAARRSGLRSMFGDGLYLFKAEIGSSGRQDPNFNYLTGIEESPAILLMTRNGDAASEYLFMRRPDPAAASWDAAGVGEAGARARSGLQGGVFPLDEFDSALRQAMQQSPRVVVSTLSPTGDETVASVIEQMEGSTGRRSISDTPYEGIRFVNARRALSEMRSIKSTAEIELLKVAGNITRLAHMEAMKVTEPGMNEFEVQAAIEYTFRRYGSERPGFSSIIGSGPNSLILHYNANNHFMEAGDVMVMDIGAEYSGYTADVTRTIPITGEFTREQREIYEIVLAAHEAARKLAETEGTPYSDLNTAANRVLSEGLARIGLIESPDATMPGGRGSQLRLFYFHGLGHGIGLVVHDSMPRNIVPGSCFTIEPGIYVRPNVLDMLGEGAGAEALRAKIAPAVLKYQNIGVRIEDSYAFTDNGLICLSEGTPKTVEEVERMMAQSSDLNTTRDSDLVNAYKKYRPPPE